MWHSLCALDFLLGVLNREECTCGAATPGWSRAAPRPASPLMPPPPPVPRHPSKWVQPANDVLDTDTFNKLIESTLRLDNILFAHAMLRLRKLLMRIETEVRGADLLNCF